jgi:hypothetical protein
MADLCIIYASADTKIVEALARLLSPPYEVWWGDKIVQGNYRAEIERQLSSCKCVLAVWSTASRDNQNVIDEAGFAQTHGIPLLPVILDKARAPIGFGGLQRVSISDWRNGPDNPAAQRLLERVTAIVPPSPENVARALGLKVHNCSLALPVFFNSVSSHETQLSPYDAAEALRIFGSKSILVSAYDTGRGKQSRAINNALSKCRSAGAVVLLDSGNYESSRLNDKRWTIKRLHKAFHETPHDLAFIYDDMKPPRNATGIAKRVIAAVERDSRRTKAPVLPILHVPRRSDGSYATELFDEALKIVAKHLRPILIAVPERELGDGIVQRCKAVVRIRRSLNELGFYQPLHLLGTGNPMSIAILAAAGADSFDGLEWCRLAADNASAALYHFQQYEFFAYQTQFAASTVSKTAATDKSISFAGRVVMHNLDFFQEWISEIRQHMERGKIETFLAEKLPKGVMRQIAPALT